MRKDWSDENQQTKDRVSRLATEIATQSDAGRMRMIVQRFASEIVPDSRAIVRQAIDEQAEIVDQRINLLSNEVHESVKDNEIATSQLRQVIQENHQAIRRSHAASEDEMLKDLEKLEGRIFSVEKTVRMRTPAGDLAAKLPDRAASSGANANFREINLKLEKKHERFAKWVSESIGGINDEQASLVERMSRLQSGRGSQAVDRPSGPDSPQDWHQAIDQVRVQRNRRDHDDVIARFETVKSHVEQYEAKAGILNHVIDDIRRQIRNLPTSSDQARSAVRRELDSFRNLLEGAMRRLTTVESNMRTLNGMNNRIMGFPILKVTLMRLLTSFRVSSRISRGLKDPGRGGILGTGQGQRSTWSRKWSGYWPSGRAGRGCWSN